MVLYLRLSDEDKKTNYQKEELSQSIKNQEIMLRDYAEEQGWEVVGVYNDDDWSGSDATRPDFNRMIEECKKTVMLILFLCKNAS
ncbi:MAG: recombinase family protein [Bacilli bacterium]|nr:MAG: recombinase family protein [Bacilli bacterium]